MNKIQGKNILIVGAGDGVGKSLVNKLYKDNSIYCITRTSSKLFNHPASGTDRFFVKEKDISEGPIDKEIDDCIHRLGSIDILMIVAGQSLIGDFTQYTDTDILDVINTNIYSTTLIIHRVAQYMAQVNSGYIVCMSSQSSINSYPINSIYSATKLYLNKLISDASYDLAKYNIKINAVAPGIISTGFLDKIRIYEEGVLDLMKSSEMIDPEVVADYFIEAVCSDKYKSGETIECFTSVG